MDFVAEISEGIQLEASRADALAAIEEKREAAEDGGVLVDGNVYDASSESRIRLNTMLIFATRDPNYTGDVKLKSGGTVNLTGAQIFKVVSAMTNLMQTLIKWEQSATEQVNSATDASALEVAVVESETQAPPTGDAEEPQPPESSGPEPDFSKNEFEDVQCSTIDVSQTAHVAGTADIASLYARDKMAIGSVFVDRSVKARKWVWSVVGSFWWRRGDRMPTSAMTEIVYSRSSTRAAVRFFDVSRNETVAYALGGYDDRTIRSNFSNLTTVPDDDTFFEIEIHCGISDGKGWITLHNVIVSMA